MIEPGALGGSRYEFEWLIPDAWAGVIVQLGREEAIRLIWWHRPEYAGMPPEEVPGMDEEEFVDTLREAVRAWVSTFPLVPAAAPDAVQHAKESE